MKNHFQLLLAICLSLFARINTEQLYFGHRIRTDITSYELTFYAFEMTPMRNIENCVESCKSKKQCKIINYDHKAKLCYHVGSDINEEFFQEDFVEEKPVFSYGVKREWNMKGYEQCESCYEVGVCSQNGAPAVPKCQNSGCRLPVEKSNAFYRGNLFSIGNKVEYKCQAGYKSNVTDPLTITCLQNGSWSDLVFRCLPESVFGSNVHEKGNNYYKVNLKKQNWDEADAECQRMKLHLVYIKSEAEQKFIEEIIPEPYGNVCFWIGGVRTSDDKFEWLDGEQITEYQWDKEQPNNIDGQYCITLNPGTYKWNDRGCSSYCYSVCELL
ncbi:neurocan core protein-like [Ruditapes philippinarum]|uniref:neurocan core protein-like n=1 Tax=Ruditapes philippinarum TaxID=129788 RepID=UPI00295B29CF|nr:neurocan core protein-like [Ruditapes philippinarum]